MEYGKNKCLRTTSGFTQAEQTARWTTLDNLRVNNKNKINLIAPKGA